MKMIFVGGRKDGDVDYCEYPPEKVFMLKESPLVSWKVVSENPSITKVETEAYNRYFVQLSPQTERIAVYRHEDVGNEQWKRYLLTKFNIT